MTASSTDAEAALLADEEVLRLWRHMGLAERFALYLLVGTGPVLSGRVLSVLPVEVGIRRGRPVKLVRVDPYFARRPEEILTAHELLAAVLPSLSSQGDNANTVVAVDASRAPQRDAETWEVLFQRMNVRRNHLLQQFAGSLLLVLPEALEIAFVNCAPDFWSVRSSVFRPSPPSGVSNTGAPSIVDQYLTATEQLREDPSDTDALLRRLHFSGLLAHEAERVGDLVTAHALAEARVSAARHLASLIPPPTSLRVLLGPLSDLARIAMDSGDPSAATDARAEADLLAAQVRD